MQILLLFLIITAESQWKIYKKAGKEGWASIVPIYNIIVLLEIVKKPTWWLILLIIPFVNIVITIWMTNLLSEKFGKDEGFTIGLIFLPFIFYPLLGMSKAEYIDD
ncbi:MAG: signal peptidase I [Bacteroidales bacterium]|nr:signal peptidase I [Bacteroidales bacterium]